MEQKFLVYKLADSDNRDTMESNINSYLRCGWLVKDIKVIQSDKNIYATVIVLIEKMSNTTISIN
jgi:hypothetical protein